MGAIITGDIACEMTSGDSLCYVSFDGVALTGNLQFGPTGGTWVLYMEHCYWGALDADYNATNTGAPYLSGAFTVASATVLLETMNSHLKGHICKIDDETTATTVELYECFNTRFDLINVTPLNGQRVIGCRFDSDITITAKTLSIDSYSYKNMIDKTEVLTGCTVTIFETNGAGAKAATGNSVVDTSSGSLHTSTFTLSNVALTLTAAGAGVGFGNVKLYDFPAGYIYVQGIVADLAITSADADLSDTWNGDIAFGSAADADGSLAGTELDLVPKTATPAATAKATTGDCVSTAVEHIILDGHSTASDLILNLLADAADIADASTAPVAISGTITVTWINLGDN
jgi:hypothetical protein